MGGEISSGEEGGDRWRGNDGGLLTAVGKVMVFISPCPPRETNAIKGGRGGVVEKEGQGGEENQNKKAEHEHFFL